MGRRVAARGTGSGWGWRRARLAPPGQRLLATTLLAVGLFVALALAGDVATTACGMTSGATREINPVTLWWMNRFGLKGWMVFRLCLALVVGAGSIAGARASGSLAGRPAWLAGMIPPVAAVAYFGALSAVTVIGNVEQGSLSCLSLLGGR